MSSACLFYLNKEMVKVIEETSSMERSRLGEEEGQLGTRTVACGAVLGGFLVCFFVCFLKFYWEIPGNSVSPGPMSAGIVNCSRKTSRLRENL